MRPASPGRQAAQGRPRPTKADIAAAAGAVDEVARIVARIRAAWPDVRIWLRADSGFARDGLMSWCETNDVGYVLGLARNDRLNAELAEDLAKGLAAAAADSAKTGKNTLLPARRFKDFTWRTRDSWSREPRVVGKAE